MIRFNFIFLLLALLLLIATPLYSAVADDDSVAITATRTEDGVIFTCTFEYSTSDSTANLYSKAIDVTWLTPEDGVLQVYGNAATGIDINLFMGGANSLDLTYFTFTLTDPNLDALGSATAKLVKLDQYYGFVDSLGNISRTVTSVNKATDTSASSSDQYVVEKYPDPSFDSRYLVFKADGQTGNPSTATLTLILKLKFRPEYWERKKKDTGLLGYEIKDTT